MNTVIIKEIGLGDAGTPFLLTIDVEYEIQQGVAVIITECVERECPYDNPSEKWYARIKEIVEDYFYEQNENYQIHFQ